MANWYGTSRSNYFRVKDADAFKAAMEAYDGIEVWDKDDMFGLGAGALSDSGEWPSYNIDTDEEFFFPEIVAPFLADGEVAIFMTAGAEKMRYVTGHAVAIDNTLKQVVVNIDDIYAKALDAFGVQPTVAQY